MGKGASIVTGLATYWLNLVGRQGSGGVHGFFLGR